MIRKLLIAFSILIVVILVIAGIGAGAWYYYNNYMNVPDIVHKLSATNTFEAQSELSKENIDIAEPFEYIITVARKKGTDVNIEKKDIKKDKDQFKNLLVNDFKQEVKELSGDVELIIQKYYLQPEDIINTEIPAFKISNKDKTIDLKPLKVKVNSVLDPKNEMKSLHDIKPLEKYFIIRWYYVAVPLVILVLIGLLAYVVYLLFKVIGKKQEIKVIKPPHILAFEELAMLKAMELNSQRDFDIFYTRLSEVFRKYLEGRFNIPAIERTSEEISAEIMGYNFNMETRNLAKLVLRQSDLIKFAKYASTKELAYSTLEKTYQFVEITKPYSQLRTSQEAYN